VRLLLIDDAAPLRQTFAAILQNAGFLVVEAAGGHDGLRQLQEAPVDLVLTDLEMPGMSGWDVAREVRRLHPDLPVVLVTGNSGALEVGADLRALVRAILLKPLGARQLLDVVGRLAAERPSRHQRLTMQTGRQLSVLLVEDNAGDARIIQECLRGHPAARLVWSDTLATALTHLAQPDLDLVLLDLNLPDSHGLDTVTRVVREHPALPVIVVTGCEDHGLALAALAAGAEDYLVKGAIEPDVLVRSIQYAYERKRVELAHREAHEFTNQIIRHIQEGIAVYDRELRHRIWNPFLEALSGVPAARVLGRHVREISPLLDGPTLVATLHRALDGEVVTLPEILSGAAGSGRGQRIAAIFGPLRDVQGETIGVIANIRDITTPTLEKHP
jgi:PAS domain S-box-containing protein